MIFSMIAPAIALAPLERPPTRRLASTSAPMHGIVTRAQGRPQAPARPTDVPIAVRLAGGLRSAGPPTLLVALGTSLDAEPFGVARRCSGSRRRADALHVETVDGVARELGDPDTAVGPLG